MRESAVIQEERLSEYYFINGIIRVCSVSRYVTVDKRLLTKNVGWEKTTIIQIFEADSTIPVKWKFNGDKYL